MGKHKGYLDAVLQVRNSSHPSGRHICTADLMLLERLLRPFRASKTTKNLQITVGHGRSDEWAGIGLHGAPTGADVVQSKVPVESTAKDIQELATLLVSKGYEVTGSFWFGKNPSTRYEIAPSGKVISADLTWLRHYDVATIKELHKRAPELLQKENKK